MESVSRHARGGAARFLALCPFETTHPRDSVRRGPVSARIFMRAARIRRHTAETHGGSVQALAPQRRLRQRRPGRSRSGSQLQTARLPGVRAWRAHCAHQVTPGPCALQPLGGLPRVEREGDVRTMLGRHAAGAPLAARDRLAAAHWPRRQPHTQQAGDFIGGAPTVWHVTHAPKRHRDGSTLARRPERRAGTKRANGRNLVATHTARRHHIETGNNPATPVLWRTNDA